MELGRCLTVCLKTGDNQENTLGVQVGHGTVPIGSVLYSVKLSLLLVP